MQAKYEGVSVYMSQFFPPCLPPFPGCIWTCFLPLSLQEGSALPLPHVPSFFLTVCSAGAVVPAGERLPTGLPWLFGGEPALQVSSKQTFMAEL